MNFAEAGVRMGMFLRPDNLPEALQALARAPLTVLAGGTDFYPARVGKFVDEDVLDISAIECLRGIRDEDDHWLIGAATTWSDIIEADLPACFHGLQLAAREVGGAQIQNAGTVGGNLCNASPAADGVPPLLSLDAEVVLSAHDGVDRLPLSVFIQGNRRIGRRPDQLLTDIRVPKPSGRAMSGFSKLGARRYLVISIAMVAVLLELADDRTLAAARIAVGACSEVAQRLPALEARLMGRSCDGTLGGVLRESDLDGLNPIDDARGDADYRLDAVATLIRRLLNDLGARA